MSDAGDICTRLRKALPTLEFFPPATSEQIARVERRFGVSFPPWLRELYLHCNGIKSSCGNDCYLMALESNDDFRESVASWNEFLRSEWDVYLPDLKENRPDVPWDDFDRRKLIFIGRLNGTEWAVRTDGSTEIIWHDVRNPESWDVIADDIVEACIKEEERHREIYESLFRGRTPYHHEPDEIASQRDIDRIFFAINYIHMGRRETGTLQSPWHIERAISQRPGETGELYIISYGDDLVRLFSVDGNFPFVMRLKDPAGGGELSFIAWILKDTVMKILQVRDLLLLPYDADGKPQKPDAEAVRSLWRYTGMPEPDLEETATVLCRRDDNRRNEENHLG
jgi:hypothetical protein